MSKCPFTHRAYSVRLCSSQVCSTIVLHVHSDMHIRLGSPKTVAIPKTGRGKKEDGLWKSNNSVARALAQEVGHLVLYLALPRRGDAELASFAS